MSATVQTGFDFTKGSAPYTGAAEVLKVRENADQFREGFEAWLIANWHIWREFSKQADIVEQRFAHYSARTIIEWMRHHTALAESNGLGWKINNNVIPDLARLYMLMKAPGFFETRVAPQGVRVK